MSTKQKRASNKQTKETIRASISFPLDDYAKLEEVANSKRVSLAWIVREAVREYLDNDQKISGKI